MAAEYPGAARVRIPTSLLLALLTGLAVSIAIYLVGLASDDPHWMRVANGVLPALLVAAGLWGGQER